MGLSMMTMRKQHYFFIIFLLTLTFFQAKGQYNVPLYTPYTTSAQRAELYDRLTHTAILQGLGQALSDSTEDQWEGAFDAMEVLRYHNPFVRNRLQAAFDSVDLRSPSFTRALLEAVYTNYPHYFQSSVSSLMHRTRVPKIFAMCAEYLLRSVGQTHKEDSLLRLMKERFQDSCQTNPILIMLSERLADPPFAQDSFSTHRLLKEVLGPDFLPGQIVMYSFQRKDRDFPGLVLVRNAQGKFITDSSGRIFSVPQLARSITNLPGYLTNGNTPQGIFRMYGFGVSESNFIGPTANVQMGMPVELGVGKFFGDSLTTDTVWTKQKYATLLPPALRNYLPLYETFYAGLCGRTEIIAHGTTIDPSYYKGTPYYPLTPTDGCLCTRELWNGIRLESDQQKLVNALLQAGGATGYCVVVTLDDRKSPVTLKELVAYLPR